MEGGERCDKNDSMEGRDRITRLDGGRGKMEGFKWKDGMQEWKRDGREEGDGEDRMEDGSCGLEGRVINGTM